MLIEVTQLSMMPLGCAGRWESTRTIKQQDIQCSCMHAQVGVKHV